MINIGPQLWKKFLTKTEKDAKFQNTEAATGGVLQEKVFLEISQNFSCLQLS